MKLADSIYPLLDLPERGEMMTCAEINAKTMEYAISIASETALERMNLKGRSLTFVEDKVYSWGGCLGSIVVGCSGLLMMTTVHNGPVCARIRRNA